MVRTLLCALTLTLAAFAADITGKWDFTVETSAGSGSPVFELTQKGEDVSGTYTGALGQAKVAGTVKGDAVVLKFTVDYGGETVNVEYQGKLESAAKIKGTVKLGTFGEGTFTGAKR